MDGVARVEEVRGGEAASACVWVEDGGEVRADGAFAVGAGYLGECEGWEGRRRGGGVTCTARCDVAVTG